MGDEVCEQTKNADSTVTSRFRQRTNCECICELGYELRELDGRMQKLNNAIKADPAGVRAEAKALWPAQLNAMNDYKKALFARIIDLIDHDI